MNAADVLAAQAMERPTVIKTLRGAQVNKQDVRGVMYGHSHPHLDTPLDFKALGPQEAKRRADAIRAAK